MQTLPLALAWAARGFKVFPLIENGKTPALGGSWLGLSTADPDAIKRLWIDPVTGVDRGYNIGCECTDIVVIDVDVKDGKDGHNQYMQLCGFTDTLKVSTPSGGYHLYFNGPDSSNAPLAPAVDVRSHHGYVVAPGSTIDGTPYTVENDISMEWVPLAVDQRLRAAYERKEVEASQALDSLASTQAAINYLRSAPVAVQGRNGDELTFTTAAHLVRELALSEVAALELMAEHWNPRCEPPWSLEELEAKIQNAVRYGTADVGRLDPSVLFANIELPEPPSVFEQKKGLTWGNAVLPNDMPPRPWMIDRMLMLHETTLLMAPGAAGKSSLSLAIVAHLAVGADFAGHTTKVKCKSVVYNGEDDIAEQSRRLFAVCQSYNLDYQEVFSQVMLISGDEMQLRLVGSAGRTPVVNDTVVSQLVNLVSDKDVGLIVYDPLVDAHDVDEGDNPAMNTVMRTIRRVAKEGKVASLVLHHTSKGGNSRQEDRVGNMDIGRGASGIVYKSRIAFTLLNASQQDAEDYGMQDKERLSWVRLDDAKMNLAKAGEKTNWFRKEGVRILSGDVVGVLKHSNLEKNTNNLRARVGNLLVANMQANGQGSMLMLQAVALLKNEEPLWANKTDTNIRQKLEGMFGVAVEIQGRTLRVRRDVNKGKTQVLITLT